MKKTMKYLKVVLIVFLTVTCSEQLKEQTNIVEVIKSVDWITGNWVRVNDNKNRSTFEHWNKISEKEYKGFCYTLEQADTVFKEYLRIFHNGNWYLEVTGVNENPTLFNFLDQSDSSFISENKENDFPKKIKYSFSKNNLTAIISDDSTSLSFVFKNINDPGKEFN